MDKYAKIALIGLLAFILIKSFSSLSSSKEYKKNPVDELIRDMNDIPNFSIILYDMEFEENTFGSDVYRQKYQIITTKDDEIDVEETDWKEVPRTYFESHVNDMGMEIASKVDGKLSKTTAPAGYSQFVGNSQYGQWTNRGGSSFWEFYGKYAMMSSLFNLMSPVPRGYYNDYSSNYRNTNRPYYGSSANGGTSYGTSSTMKNRGTTSSWSKSQSAFKSSVQSRVSRSKSRATTSRTGRSSSSSYRSRGGGFGK